MMQKLMKFFKHVSIIHKPRSENWFPDALATLGARTEFEEGKAYIEIVKMFEPSAIKDFSEPPEDWRRAIKVQLTTGAGFISTMKLSCFMILRKELYHRASQGRLARCVGSEEARKRLNQIHDDNCGDNEIALYKRIQQQGYYWPSMKKDADVIVKNCTRCSLYEVKLECSMVCANDQEID